MYRSIIVGCGGYLPENKVSNKDLEKIVDTSDEWIFGRTGIRNRHVAADGQVTSDLALEACSRALKSADMPATDIDLIVLATATPDYTFPATATTVQSRLGIHHGAAFDVAAVCTGFIYAMAVADNFIRVGQAKNVLVCGAETFSRILDWEDRTTCVLFGDGAGAVVLSAAKMANGDARNGRGVLSTHLHSDGRHRDLLYVDGGVSATQTTGHLRMRGPEVYKHAVVNLAAVVREALDENQLTSKDIDWLVPHQANQRIIDSTGRKLGVPSEKVVSTIADHGNTSAASVPLALNAAVEDGRIKQGDLVLMEAMGGGFSWGAALARW